MTSILYASKFDISVCGVVRAKMRSASRKIAFVLVSSDHGTMIVNRFDYRMTSESRGYGVGFELLQHSSYAPEEVDLAIRLLGLRRKYYGDGLIAIDCGANIGVHTIEWARSMTGWGSVVAIEAQERVYYALAGNIAINNCFNAKAILAAVSSERGVMRIPQPDYLSPGSFGSLELKKGIGRHDVGQRIKYDGDTVVEVPTITLDGLTNRVDLVKLDVEGMELEALEGARGILEKYRPALIVESLKTDEAKLRRMLEGVNYLVFKVGINLVALHRADEVLTDLKTQASAG